MENLKIIIELGFTQGMDAIKESNDTPNGYKTVSSILNAEWDDCSDLDCLKAFALIMIDNHHVVDVEPKMIELMGEDDFFDFID